MVPRAVSAVEVRFSGLMLLPQYFDSFEVFESSASTIPSSSYGSVVVDNLATTGIREAYVISDVVVTPTGVKTPRDWFSIYETLTGEGVSEFAGVSEGLLKSVPLSSVIRPLSPSALSATVAFPFFSPTRNAEAQVTVSDNDYRDCSGIKLTFRVYGYHTMRVYLQNLRLWGTVGERPYRFFYTSGDAADVAPLSASQESSFERVGSPQSVGYLNQLSTFAYEKQFDFTGDATWPTWPTKTGNVWQFRGSVAGIGAKTIELDVDGQVFSHPLTANDVFQVTLEKPPQLARLRGKDSANVWSHWENLRLLPRPKFAFDPDSPPDIELDGSESVSFTDGTGSNAAITKYRWNLAQSANVVPDRDTATPKTTFELDVADGLSYQATLKVYETMSDVAGYYYLKPFISSSEGTRSHALTDPHGAMFTAANRKENVATQTTAGVQITRHHVDSAGHYVGFTLQGVPNLQNPTLMQHPGTHALYLFAQNRNTKAWELWSSDDWGEAWELMANSPMDTNYKGVVPCALDSGGFALTGVKKSTTPPEVWFARTWDGVTYDAIAGGTGTGQTLKLVGSKTGAKTVAIHQEKHVGSARLVVIVDGTPFKFSEDYGDSWEDAAA